MEDEEKFSEDQQENLRIENEFLKIKLRAQYGDAFHMESINEMPPSIENQFLKSMMAIEEEYAHAEYTTVYERIGKPAYRAVSEMDSIELRESLDKLLKILAKNDIGFEIIDGPYPDELIYRFITEELFVIKVDKEPVPGWDCQFTYEEFYPNHKADLVKRTKTFFTNWLSGKFSEYSTELAWHCISADGTQLTREDIVAKMNIFFKAFRQFRNGRYTIDKISFELGVEGQPGMGFTEGFIQYDALIENGELISYQGAYKLYLQREEDWWSIFYFVIPGFNW